MGNGGHNKNNCPPDRSHDLITYNQAPAASFHLDSEKSLITSDESNLTFTTSATGTIYSEQSIHAQISHEPEGSRAIIFTDLAGF